MINKADIETKNKNSFVNVESDGYDSGLHVFLNGFGIVSRGNIKMSDFRKRWIAKYIIPASKVSDLLSECMGSYKILERNGVMQVRLALEYFDTPDLRFFGDHVNGKLNRTKIRIKQCSSSSNRYWEIWKRKSKGRMIRKRVIIDRSNPGYEDKISELVYKYAGISNSELIPSLQVTFNRITLLDTVSGERVNIDSNLVFTSPVQPEIQYEPEGLAIIEIRKKRRAYSYMTDLLEKNQIRKSGISKYCLGISFTNPKAKINNYKPVIRRIEKTLSNGIVE